MFRFIFVSFQTLDWQTWFIWMGYFMSINLSCSRPDFLLSVTQLALRGMDSEVQCRSTYRYLTTFYRGISLFLVDWWLGINQILVTGKEVQPLSDGPYLIYLHLVAVKHDWGPATRPMVEPVGKCYLLITHSSKVYLYASFFDVPQSFKFPYCLLTIISKISTIDITICYKNYGLYFQFTLNNNRNWG